LDFQQLAFSTKSGFWQLLLRELGTRLIELPEEYRRDIDLDLESLLQPWDEILAAELGTKLRQLALTSKGIKPVIVMDEFESTIDNPHLDYGFYGALRSFNSELTYVTVTQSPLHRLRYRSPSTITSPFFNIFVEIPVELFSPENARRLLLKLSSLGETPFSPGDIEFLIGLAGCHPFFLQRAGYYLFELRSGKGSRAERTEVYRDVERSFYQEARGHFQYFWDGLDAERKTALKRASEGGSFTKESLAELERIALVDLAEQSFVSESKEGYQVFSRAFGQFIRNQL
jgi:hypothetical protein